MLPSFSRTSDSPVGFPLESRISHNGLNNLCHCGSSFFSSFSLIHATFQLGITISLDDLVKSPLRPSIPQGERMGYAVTI